MVTILRCAGYSSAIYSTFRLYEMEGSTAMRTLIVLHTESSDCHGNRFSSLQLPQLIESLPILGRLSNSKFWSSCEPNAHLRSFSTAMAYIQPPLHSKSRLFRHSVSPKLSRNKFVVSGALVLVTAPMIRARTLSSTEFPRRRVEH
jgi:hypothetical protein